MSTTPDPIEAKARECAEKLTLVPHAQHNVNIIAAAMREAVQRETKELRADLALANQNYEEALAERNKAWRKADEIEAEHATRITRDQYREHEVKKLNAERDQLRAALDVAEDRCMQALARIAELRSTAPVKNG